MAGTKYAYVRSFELPDPLLPGTFMIFRLDGHSFHRFSDNHKFVKPNDLRALQLMDHAARDVMEEYNDIILAFGESDEYSFLLRKSTSLYNRRESKIVTTLTSLFTSSYVFHWPSYFPDNPLQYPPSFDGRIVLYPETRHVRDYFAWRQADTHINNLYNTVFWALVQQGGETTTQAHTTLRGTVSKEKHEILFSKFGINYNTLDARFRKGSVLVREKIQDLDPNLAMPLKEARGSRLSPASHVLDQIHSDPETEEHRPDQVIPPPDPDSAAATTTAALADPPLAPITSEIETIPPPEDGETKREAAGKTKRAKTKSGSRTRTRIDVLHCDVIKDEFWDSRPEILEG